MSHEQRLDVECSSDNAVTDRVGISAHRRVRLASAAVNGPAAVTTTWQNEHQGTGAVSVVVVVVG